MEKKFTPLFLTRILLIFVICSLSTILAFELMQGKEAIFKSIKPESEFVPTEHHKKTVKQDDDDIKRSFSLKREDLYTSLYITIGLLTMFILYKKYRKKNTVQKTKTALQQNLQTTIEKVEEQAYDDTPEHPVRKWLLEWERSLNVQNQRRPWETINNWLHRIKKLHPPSVTVYERVRYGQKDVTDEELHLFQENFKKEDM